MTAASDPAAPGNILVLDYPGLNATQRVKSLGLDRLGPNVRYLLEEVRPRRIDLVGYAADLARYYEMPTTAAIVAYCAAAPIARQLCRTAFDRGHRPPLCLIDPETADPDAGPILLRSLASAAGLTRAFPATVANPRSLTIGDLATVEAALTERYTRELFTDLTDDESSVAAAYLASARIDWMCHLFAAGDSAQPAATTDELHVTSRQHRCPVDCVARHHSVDADGAELFQRSGLATEIWQGLRL